MVPIGANGCPRRSCQRVPSALRRISTVSGSANAAKNTSPRSFRNLASCRSYVPSLSTPLYDQELPRDASNDWYFTKKNPLFFFAMPTFGAIFLHFIKVKFVQQDFFS